MLRQLRIFTFISSSIQLQDEPDQLSQEFVNVSGGAVIDEIVQCISNSEADSIFEAMSNEGSLEE